MVTTIVATVLNVPSVPLGVMLPATDCKVLYTVARPPLGAIDPVIVLKIFLEIAPAGVIEPANVFMVFLVTLPVAVILPLNDLRMVFAIVPTAVIEPDTSKVKNILVLNAPVGVMLPDTDCVYVVPPAVSLNSIAIMPRLLEYAAVNPAVLVPDPVKIRSPS